MDDESRDDIEAWRDGVRAVVVRAAGAAIYADLPNIDLVLMGDDPDDGSEVAAMVNEEFDTKHLRRTNVFGANTQAPASLLSRPQPSVTILVRPSGRARVEPETEKPAGIDDDIHQPFIRTTLGASPHETIEQAVERKVRECQKLAEDVQKRDAIVRAQLATITKLRSERSRVWGRDSTLPLIPPYRVCLDTADGMTTWCTTFFVDEGVTAGVVSKKLHIVSPAGSTAIIVSATLYDAESTIVDLKELVKQSLGSMLVIDVPEALKDADDE